MFYVLAMVVAAVAIAATTRRSRRAALRVGVVAIAMAVVAVATAEVTGNLLLYYLGALAGPFGVMVVLLHLVGTLRRGGGMKIQ